VTTYEEISTSEEANWAFWTDRAKLCLACYRSTGNRLERSGFLANMKNRRNMVYLNVETGARVALNASFTNGKLHGLETWWCENGQKDAEINYVNGSMTYCKEWNKNGDLLEVEK